MKYKLKKAKAIFPYFLSNKQDRWKKSPCYNADRWKIFHVLTMLGIIMISKNLCEVLNEFKSINE